MPETNGIFETDRCGICDIDPGTDWLVWQIDVDEWELWIWFWVDERLNCLLLSFWRWVWWFCGCWSISNRIGLLGSKFRARKRGRLIESKKKNRIRRNKVTNDDDTDQMRKDRYLPTSQKISRKFSFWRIILVRKVRLNENENLWRKRVFRCFLFFTWSKRFSLVDMIRSVKLV